MVEQVKRNSLAFLLRCKRGMAAVELGLALPILMLLILGGMEFANFVVAHHRVRQMAAMVADNASRPRTRMTEAYINQLFVGVDKSGAAMGFKQKGRVILSSIQNNAAENGQWIRWQRCFGNLGRVSKIGAQNKGEKDSTLPNVMGLTAQPGSAMMFAEATYMYRPLFRNPFTTDQEIYHEVAFIVRQRSDFGISGTSAATC